MGTITSIDGKLVMIDKNGQIIPPKPAGGSSGSPPPAPPPDDATKVKVPVGEVSQSAAKGGRPGDDAVIARNRWRFKACYNKALATDPTAGGSASFTVKIAADGSVTSTASTSGLSPTSLDACARGAFGAMKFEQPGPATIVVPLFFSTKKPD